MLLLTLVSCALITDAQQASRMDLDGDGVSRPEDCDDADDAIGAASTWFVDEDLDGYGSTTKLTECAPAGGVAEVSGDCDDANPTTFPGAEEACNYEDDDCDGVADDGVEPPTWYFDGDGDGYGTGATTNVGCTAPAGYVAISGDCNDSDTSLNPETAWYPDVDEDGYGDSALPTLSCDAPAGLLREGTDCNDADPAIHPDAQEVCDDVDTDEDCDGLADNDDADALADGFSTFYVDSDGDGYGDATSIVEACDISTGLVTDGRDCDDTTSASGIECGWIDVSTGRTVACGVRGSGLVECWGEDEYGYGLLSSPAGAFTSVVAGDSGMAACGLRVDGTLECWGDLTYIGAPPSGTFTAIAGGADFCALGTDQSIQCWGQYPDVASDEPRGPQSSIASAVYAAVALDPDGTATSWGSTWYGPIDLPNSDYTAVSAGPYWVCGLRADASADCVGDNLPIALYYASEDSEETYPGPYAAVVPGDSQITFLDGEGNATVLTVSNAGEAESLPSGRWLMIDYEYFYGCGIQVDGSLACWGQDNMGEGQTTPPE